MRTLILTLILMLSQGPARCAEPDNEQAKRLAGCWRGLDREQASLVRFEETRCLLYEKGRLQAFAARYEPGKLILRSLGHQVAWQLEFKGDVLILAMPDAMKPIAFRKLDEVPTELELKPLQLGKGGAVPADKVKEIQQELARRLKLDQQVRLDPAKQPMMAQVDADNTAYLIQFVQESGWIDVGRFGHAAANAAFLIAQHSGHLRLMLAALPAVEKDFKAKHIDGQAFALMSDRLQALLGERQRYGTQLAQNNKGEWFVLALQDPAKVDQFRQQVGLSPLPQYLDTFKRANSVKGEIKFEDDLGKKE